jgi:hypothetical protein
VAFLWVLVTKGRPPNRALLQGVNHVDTVTEEIFETTIVVEKKRFTKRIIEQSEGYWSYIPYANQPRWIDLEIHLTTRIGFDIQHGATSYDEHGKLKVDFFEPSVLSKTWST